MLPLISLSTSLPSLIEMSYSYGECVFPRRRRWAPPYCAVDNESGGLGSSREFIEELTNRLGIWEVTTDLCQKCNNTSLGTLEVAPNNMVSATGCLGVPTVTPYVDHLRSF